MSVDREKLRQAMNEVAAVKGDFTLFALFLREDAPDKWDLIISAPWLDEGKLKALGEFVDRVSAILGPEGVLQLSRIITVNANDPRLDAILRAVRVEGGGPLEVSDSTFFGMSIKHAYIFRAARPQQAQNQGQ